MTGAAEAGLAEPSHASSRRAAILDAAIELFAERGFDGATWREIAERASVTQGLIRFYFGDKEALWRAAFALAHERRMAGMPPPVAVPGMPKPDKDLVAAWAYAFAVHIATHPDEARMVVREGQAGSERMVWAAEEVLRAAHDVFLVGVEALQAYGWFEGFAPKHVLYMLVGASQYVFLVPGEVAALTGEDSTADDYIDAHARAVVRLFMAHAPAD